MYSSSELQTTSDGDIASTLTFKCPCFQQVHISTSTISDNSTKIQSFRCTQCMFEFQVDFKYNVLGASHFFNDNHALACQNYKLAHDAGETTNEEYLFNIHECLNAWSRPDAPETIPPSEATERLQNIRLELEEQLDAEEYTFWFDDEALVCAMKEEEEEFSRQNAERIANATKVSGLSRDEAKRKMRGLLKKLRKIDRLKLELDAGGAVAESALTDDQLTMLENKSTIKIQLQTLDDLFRDLL